MLLRVSFFVFLLRRHQFLGSSERKLMVIIDKDSEVNVAEHIAAELSSARSRRSEAPWVIKFGNHVTVRPSSRPPLRTSGKPM